MRLKNIIFLLLLLAPAWLWGQNTPLTPVFYKIRQPTRAELGDTAAAVEARAKIFAIATADSAAHDSAQAALTAAKIFAAATADSAAGDSSRAALVAAKIFAAATADSAGGDSAQAALTAAKTFAAATADSAAGDSLNRIRNGQVGNLDSLSSSIIKIGNAYKLATADGTPGQFVTTNGVGQWGYTTSTPNAAPDSFPYSYVIGRGTGGNENYSCATDSTLAAGVHAGFTALATTGGTIFIKRNSKGTWVWNNTDTLPSFTKTIVLKGEEGGTVIYHNGADYAIYDTVNVGKLWMAGGLEWRGTTNSLGVIRTGPTITTNADSCYIKDCAFYSFTHSSSTVFLTDTLTQGWVIDNCRGDNNVRWQYLGRGGFFERLKIRNHSKVGLQINSTQGTVTNCNFYNCDSAGIIAYPYSANVYAISASSYNLIIDGCGISWPDSNAATVGIYVFTISGADSVRVLNKVTIINCDIQVSGVSVLNRWFGNGIMIGANGKYLAEILIFLIILWEELFITVYILGQISSIVLFLIAM